MNILRLKYRTLELLNPREQGRNVKHFLQRASRGSDDQTWWSLDYAIAQLIVDNLPKLIEKNQGVAMRFYRNGDFKDTTHWSTTPAGDARAERRRNDAYTKILRGMELFLAEGGFASKEDQAEIDQALKLLAKYFTTLWD